MMRPRIFDCCTRASPFVECGEVDCVCRARVARILIGSGLFVFSLLSPRASSHSKHTATSGVIVMTGLTRQVSADRAG